MTTEQQIEALQQRIEKLEELVSPSVGKLECGEPEWEIAAIRYIEGGQSIYSKKDKEWCRGPECCVPDNIIQHRLKEGAAVIHSIKVKDVVYSVGDKIVWDWADTTLELLTIKSWEIDTDKELRVRVEETNNYYHIKNLADGYNLRHYTSVTPILITEDGAKCYDKERVVRGVNVNSWGTINQQIQHIEYHYKNPQWKWFSTQEARTEYILMNKPLLNMRDVEKMLQEYNGIEGDIKGAMKYIERLVEQKLK